MYNCQNSNFVLCDTIDALIKAKVLDYFETKLILHYLRKFSLNVIFWGGRVKNSAIAVEKGSLKGPEIPFRLFWFCPSLKLAEV